jgi:hypothetical protein
MSLILERKILGPCAWRGADLAHDSAWIHVLSAGAIAEIDAALTTVASRGLHFPHFTRDDFPPPGLRAELDRHADELEGGRGFLLLRGLPVERCTDAQIEIVQYGIGLHLGEPVRQNPCGDLLGGVMAVGDPADRSARVYETSLYPPYHSDPSDVVGLPCIRKARRGGLSSLVSVASICNEILDKHPEYLGLYYRTRHFAHLCEPRPSLSRVEIEALDLFDALTHQEGLRLDMMLEPGDLQFANNDAVLHSRTAFEDDPDPALRRKMVRLWVKMPNARPLAPEFPGRNGFPA